MRNVLFFAFLGVAVCCHAQKIKRHEVAFGLYGGYFFDGESQFQVQDLRALIRNKNLPTFSYSYRINHKLFLNAKHGVQAFGYLNKNNGFATPAPNTLLGRRIRRINISAGYWLALKSLTCKAHLGFAYHKGLKARFLYEYVNGNFRESHYEYNDYNDLGAVIGVRLQHPIFWRLFGELSVDYQQMFTGIDQQQLVPSYSIGLKF